MHYQKSSSRDSDICPKCKGTGMEEYVEDGYTFLRECPCGERQRRIMQGKIEFAEIPEAFKEFRLKSFAGNTYKKVESRQCIAKSCKMIKGWLDNIEQMQSEGMGLYLYSQTKGSGKTRMATSIGNELIFEKHMQVKFATSLQVINEIKASWDNQSDLSENALLNYLIRTEVLILDDFGTEHVKDWIQDKFYHIINSRYVNKKITIFTSNMDLNNLQYDERITNRIKERCFLIPFPEESVREQIAENKMHELRKLVGME